MGIRFLHSRSGYLWCAFFVLAGFSSVSQATREYRTLVTEGISSRQQTYWAKELNSAFSDGKIATSSTVAAGKQLTIPATAKLASTAGKTAMKLARGIGPVTIGAELLSYVLANASLEVFEDDFVKEVIEGDPGITGPYKFWHSSNGVIKSSFTEACVAAWPYETNVCAQADVNGTNSSSTACGRLSGGLCYSQGWPGSAQRGTNECDATGQPLDPATGLCGEPEGEIIELSPEDWSVIEELDNLPPLSDAQADDLMAKNPDGAPVESPEHPTLPEEFPLTEAYQEPGADPATGQWWQDIAKLFPAPYPKVGVEEKIVPVSGPAGIEEPTPYTGPETEQELETGSNDPTPVTIVEGDTTIEVQICEPGDTRLMCTELGTPPEEEIPSDVFDLTWDHAPVVFSEGACPAGPSAMTPWGEVTFDMYWPCEFAKAIKPIILVCAMFAALYIFITGLRTN